MTCAELHSLLKRSAEQKTKTPQTQSSLQEEEERGWTAHYTSSTQEHCWSVCGETTEKPHQQVIARLLVSFFPPQMPSEDTGNPANESRRCLRALVTPKSDQLLPASVSAFSLLPVPSELGCSCTALPQPGGCFLWCKFRLFLLLLFEFSHKLEEVQHCICLVQAIGSAGVLGKENNIMLERKEKESKGLLKLTHSTRVNRGALASSRTDWNYTLCYMVCPCPGGHMVSDFCLQWRKTLNSVFKTPSWLPGLHTPMDST